MFRWKSSCPSYDVTIGDLKTVQDPDCEPFRDETMTLLSAVVPDAVIISNAYAYTERVLDESGQKMSLEKQREAWRYGMNEQIDAIERMGSQVAIVRDNPRMLFNPTTCLSRLAASPQDCESTREESQKLIREFSVITDEVIADRNVAATLSIDNWICDGETCAAEKDGIPVYQDQTHLSEMWTLGRVPELEVFLERAVERTS